LQSFQRFDHSGLRIQKRRPEVSHGESIDDPNAKVAETPDVAERPPATPDATSTAPLKETPIRKAVTSTLKSHSLQQI
jgi:hypothetical protein